MTRRHLIALCGALTVTFCASGLDAKLPPLALAQANVGKHRHSGAKKFDFRVTETAAAMMEWRLSGSWSAPEPSLVRSADQRARLSASAPPRYRVLWIALFAADPVDEVMKYALIDDKEQRVEVEDDLVYRWGEVPSVSVDRDLERLVALAVKIDGAVWRVRLRWSGPDIASFLVTKDGAPILSGQSTLVRPPPATARELD